MPDARDIATNPDSPNYPVIRALSFTEDGGLGMEYLIPSTDMKANGLMVQHTLYVPGGEDYEDEIQAVMDAAINRSGTADSAHPVPEFGHGQSPAQMMLENLLHIGTGESLPAAGLQDHQAF